MDLEKFSSSLGILGMDKTNYLAKRIFSVIDEDNDNRIYFQDYAKFLDIILNGSDQDKAYQSFKIIDHDNKGTITIEDIEKMVTEVARLWNFLTNARVEVLKSYIEKVFHSLDVDGNGLITFEEYKTLYVQEEKIFGWFEFLNQDDYFFEPDSVTHPELGMETSEELLASHLKVYEGYDHLNKGLQKKITELEREVKNAISSLEKEEREKIKNWEFGKSSFLESVGYGFEDDLDLSLQFMSHESEQTYAKQIMTNHMISSIGGPKIKTSMLVSKSSQKEESDDDNPFNSDEEILAGFGMIESSPSSLRVSPSNESPRQEYKSKIESSLKKIKELKALAENGSPDLNKTRSELERMRSQASNSMSINESRSISPGGRFILKSELFSPDRVAKMKKNEEKKDTSILSNDGEDDSPKESSGLKKNRHGFLVHKEEESQKPKVKKNLSVYFGHESWNMILNMQIGMRMAVKSAVHVELLTEKDFLTICHYNLITARHKKFNESKVCKFYDYAPNAFEHIRQRYGVSNIDYLKSVGPEGLLGNLILGNMHSLTELVSTGKSGSFFYFTEDSKYMLKTISKHEFILFRRILKDYYNHMMSVRETLITRIFNLQKIVMMDGKKKIKSYFVVMTNLFASGIEIDVKYDLKGSTYGRQTRVPGKPAPDKGTALKDLDFNKDSNKVTVDFNTKKKFIEMFSADSKFLENQEIIDYSVLLGIHQIKKSKKRRFWPFELFLVILLANQMK